MVVSRLKLLAAVEMRNVNFLETTAAVRHVDDSRIEHAGNAGEFVDNFIAEFMRDPPEIFHAAGVAFADPFFVLKNIKQP